MMLATLDGAGDPTDIDPVNRESAKLQCVTSQGRSGRFTQDDPEQRADASVAYRTARAASPINYVSNDDAPTLLFHGDADRTVPFHQSEIMETALRSVGVPVKLVRMPGGDHGPTFSGADNPPDYKAEIVEWFDQHLRTEGRIR